ncbi:hypothetical protein KJ644_02025 [Candidatus Dependentiae bacterium]|nr:hypothetical protein [Candidatus Dependentiae bacterium]MBU4387230.1 hypothetical protein [Candidatus Dependentiae bacterium]MCG2756144.1 hypothetical protein [Candidatus Dependentiae bacterium]
MKIINLKFYIFIFFIFNISNAKKIQDLLQENYSIPFDQLLGKGGTGEIWGSSSSENIAIKGGENISQCDKIKKEFEIQKNIYNRIEIYDKTLFERILVLNPSKLISNIADVCAMEIPRLYPIKEETNKNLITQLKFGEENLDSVDKYENEIITGHSLGLKQINEIINKYSKINNNKTNLEQLFSDLGTFMAILHYKLQLDGLDMEICMVREKTNAEIYKLAFLDFGMCNNMSKYFKENKNNKIKKYILSALNVEKRLPNPTCTEFKSFKDNYINTAKTENCEVLATEIVEEHIIQQFIKNIVIKKYLDEKLKTNGHKTFQLIGYSNIITNWVQKDILAHIKNNNYNISTDNTFDYLNKILPNIIKQKKDANNLSNLEKIVINKLE